MSTHTSTDTLAYPALESRVLKEGYGPGAWHGADLKAALADVTADVAFWRPAAARHNIAEIALHHAWSARNVRARLSGQTLPPFVMAGEDWFEIADQRTLSWKRVLATVELEQQQLARFVADVEAGKVTASVSDEERFDLVLGITSHAIYHAGQIQLIKKLNEE